MAPANPSGTCKKRFLCNCDQSEFSEQLNKRATTTSASLRSYTFYTTPAQPHRNAEFQLRRDAEGERRTDKQRSRGETARPREAHVGKTTPGKVYHVGAGGVQRGWQSSGTSLTPPLALFASFSGLRKKKQHIRQPANQKSTNNSD